MVHFSDVDASQIASDTQGCSICFQEYEDQDDVTITKCNHLFHAECRALWRERPGGELCPLCKTKDVKILTEAELEKVILAELSYDDDFPFALVANPQHLARKLKDSTSLSDEECFDLAKEVASCVSMETLVAAKGCSLRQVLQVLMHRKAEEFFNQIDSETDELKTASLAIVDKYLENVMNKLHQDKSSAKLRRDFKKCKEIAYHWFSSLSFRGKAATVAFGIAYTAWELASSYYAIKAGIDYLF